MDVDPMLIQCWLIVYDACPALNQYLVNVLCRLEEGNYYTAVQNQTAVSAYFASKEALYSGFAEQCTKEKTCHPINIILAEIANNATFA